MIYGKTYENWKMKALKIPSEESFRIREGYDISSVADGVTRDLKNGKPLMKKIGSVISARLFYPRPSPAARAAQLFTEASTIHLTMVNSSLSEDSVRDAFTLGNRYIHEDGVTQDIIEKGVDYLSNDFPGCVGAVSARKKGDLFWGFIADAGVAVVSSTGDLKFRTPDEGPSMVSKDIWKHMSQRYNGFEGRWKDDLARLTFRSEYRNKQGVPSFGVLTGEEEALDFVRTGAVNVEKGDSVLTYTDGFSDVFFKQDGDLDGRMVDALLSDDYSSFNSYVADGVSSEGTFVLNRID